MSEQHTPPMSVKILSGVVMALIATILGYLLVYWWVFGAFEDVLNVSLLKNQITTSQKATDVKTQLLDLGYQFADEDFFQLNQPNSTNYKADALGGYVPVETEEPAEDAFYIRDEGGLTTFFMLDENGNIDQDSMTTLISE
jgi:hypothetical protein